MATAAGQNWGPWINFLSVLIFPTFHWESCGGSRALGEHCLDNCLVYHADCPKRLQGSTWQQQNGCICASLVLSSHRAKWKRYFRPVKLLIKHLKTSTDTVYGVKEGYMWWSGRRQGTSTDGAGVWSQGNTFYRVRNSPLQVTEVSPSSVLLFPRKWKSFHALFHTQSTFPQTPQTCKWMKRKTSYRRDQTPCERSHVLVWLNCSKAPACYDNGLLQGPADIKQEYF